MKTLESGSDEVIVSVYENQHLPRDRMVMETMHSLRCWGEYCYRMGLRELGDPLHFDAFKVAVMRLGKAGHLKAKKLGEG